MADDESVPFIALDLDPQPVRKAAAAGESVVSGVEEMIAQIREGNLMLGTQALLLLGVPLNCMPRKFARSASSVTACSGDSTGA